MKKSLILVWALIFAIHLLPGFQDKSITSYDQGDYHIYRESSNILQFNDPGIKSGNERVEILWQDSDPTAIAHDVKVSTASDLSFVGWNLNNYRVSLYLNSPVPLWEYYVNSSSEYPIDMTECGTYLAVGDLNVLKIFDSDSAIPIWEQSLSGNIVDLQFNQDGSIIYVAAFDYDNDIAYVHSFDLSEQNEIWMLPFQGNAQTLVLSKDDSTLVFTQYGSTSMMWVLSAIDGSVIFTAPEYNQNAPAISYDASLIVNGDYNGYVFVYEYNADLQTYEEKWNYRVAGGSAWVGGMAISEDGSKIAVGTLIFLTNSYDGEIYLFNSSTPEPVWVYEGVGDYVVDLDLSYNGSLLVAASWGPMDHSTSDFFLFRTQSNEPAFEINTQGSLLSVDLADDGSYCATTGKAVHAREFGNGGNVFAINCDLGGGFITGIIDLENNEDNSGVKVDIPELNNYYDYTDVLGSYNLDNVPGGNYFLECSKVGYLTAIIPDVIVVEGETIDLGIIQMQQAGAPPLNLTASHASGLTVELQWDPPEQGEPIQYNIYRKQYEDEPYPDQPLISVNSDQIYAVDDDALPVIHYYYVVTAEYEGNIEGPYSNESSGWISTGYIIDEISVYSGTNPTIDGYIAPGEWDDAFWFDCSDFWGIYDGTANEIGSVIGYYKMNSTQTELYVAVINYNDTVLEDHDEVALYFDDNNDGTYPSPGDNSEGNYWCAYYASGNQIKYRPIYNTGGVGDIIYLDDPQLEVSVDAGYLVYEFTLPFGIQDWEITPSEDNQSGLGLFVLDDNTPDPHGFDSWWPYDNMDIFNPADYGIITYADEIETPPPPSDLTLIADEDNILLEWSMPPINDFSCFNIYLSFERDFEIIDSTIGLSYDYDYDADGLYRFYITTVNQSGLESDASEIVEYNTISNNNMILPPVTCLLGNAPNPFNPETRISFALSNSEKVKISVYNLRGQLVRTLIDESLESGYHNVKWFGKDNFGIEVSSGIYFYQMQTSKKTSVRKMLFLK